jgi:sulfatase maturation enzyme AslB (radical SAM superfamily)
MALSMQGDVPPNTTQLSLEGLCMNQLVPTKKFSDLSRTAKGEPRATVTLRNLDALWFNTGTLCNITCVNCYIESSPRNDRLVYLTHDDVTAYLDEIRDDRLETELIGYTGGEPFMNAAFPAILETTLRRGFQTLTLTNAMQPMKRRKAIIERLAKTYGSAMRFRVSLDDYRAEIHDTERGKGSFAKALEGIRWLVETGITLEIAGRYLSGDQEQDIRKGFAGMFAAQSIAIDCNDPQMLVLFPEMSELADPPEITTACWSILNKSPDSIMCSSSRMIVKRKDAERPAVLACTLLAYDKNFELGATLKDARKTVSLNHKNCATFCVLGGAACGATREEH